MSDRLADCAVNALLLAFGTVLVVGLACAIFGTSLEKITPDEATDYVAELCASDPLLWTLGADHPANREALARLVRMCLATVHRNPQYDWRACCALADEGQQLPADPAREAWRKMWPTFRKEWTH